jgi:hypothetical protein
MDRPDRRKIQRRSTELERTTVRMVDRRLALQPTRENARFNPRMVDCGLAVQHLGRKPQRDNPYLRRVPHFGGMQGCNPQYETQTERRLERESAVYQRRRCSAEGLAAEECRGARIGPRFQTRTIDPKPGQRPAAIHGLDAFTILNVSRAMIRASRESSGHCLQVTSRARRETAGAQGTRANARDLGTPCMTLVVWAG